MYKVWTIYLDYPQAKGMGIISAVSEKRAKDILNEMNFKYKEYFVLGKELTFMKSEDEYVEMNFHINNHGW